MSILLNIHQLSHAFAGKKLFENLTFSIHEKERIGLIGPNGAGKTTLLKILGGALEPDNGTLSSKKGLKVGFLEQVPRFEKEATVRSTLEEGMSHPEKWEEHALVDQYLSELSLDGSQGIGPEDQIEKLSGGWKKRAALGRELVRQPDLLLLDEPTNHLDVESILWLEEFLKNASFATLTITHDRVFLQKVSDRIIELDRRNPGGLLSVTGNYSDYLELKAEKLNAQEQRETVLKNILRRETEWLRRGPKARGTKQQARINRAENLQDEVSNLTEKNRTQTTTIDFQLSDRQPKKLIEAKEISKSYQGHLLFSKVDLLLTPGTRIGLLGPNGCGKSTLIRVLLGIETPDEGRIKKADQLSVAFFEQNREALNPDQTLAQSISPDGDYVQYKGEFIHVKGYLDRFLFPAEKMNMKIGQLSGGEQSRLLIARLMLQPANVLVLDEPTNDLDLATLNILQECLTEFKGSILLVTHDRFFMDQVATQIIAFNPFDLQGKGELTSFADLYQWEEWLKEQRKINRKKADTETKNKTVSVDPSQKKKKLSFKEQYEFETMEKNIQLAEEELQSAEKEMQLPENISHPLRLTELTEKISQIQTKINEMYTRWAELEKKMENL